MSMDAIIDIFSDDSSTASETKRTPRDRAYELGRQLQSLAAGKASLDHDFCVLVDQFDAVGRLRTSTGSSPPPTIWRGPAR